MFLGICLYLCACPSISCDARIHGSLSKCSWCHSLGHVACPTPKNFLRKELDKKLPSEAIVHAFLRSDKENPIKLHSLVISVSHYPKAKPPTPWSLMAPIPYGSLGITCNQIQAPYTSNFSNLLLFSLN